MKNLWKELCLFRRRRNNDNKKQYLTSWYKLVPNNRLIVAVWVPRRHFSQKQSYLYDKLGFFGGFFFLLLLLLPWGGFPLYLDLQVVMLTSLFVYFLPLVRHWRLCAAAIVGHPAPRGLLLISNLQFTLTQMKPSGFIPWTKPMCPVRVSADALLATCHQNQLL